MYQVLADINDVAIKKVNLTDDYQLNVNGILDAINENTKVIFICTPNNPTGNCVKSEDIFEILNKFNGIVFVDEAYIDFVDDNFVPQIALDTKNVIRMRTFSKAYGMAGLRVGYAIGEKDLILNFEKIRNHFGMSRISQVGALAALEDYEFISDVINKVKLSRNRIADIAYNNNCKFIPSFTNFVAIDCLQDSKFAKKVLENLINNGVFVRMPYSYPQNRCIRVTVGIDKDIDLFEKYLPIALKKAN